MKQFMKEKVILSFCFAVVIQFSTYAQEDFTKQYFNAKTLFREGKYNLAMESFKPLIPRRSEQSVFRVCLLLLRTFCL